MAINSMSCKNSIPDESNHDQDDILINKILNGVEEGEQLDFENIGDTIGKLPNAVDYEDISDDDFLPDEESPSLSGTAQGVDETSDKNPADLMKEGGEETEGNGLNDGLDDLFGDSELIYDTMVSETDALDIELSAEGLHYGFSSSTRTTTDEEMLASPPDTVSTVGPDVDILDQVRSKQPTQQDLVKQYFPDFSPHKTLSFISLFKSKPTTLAVPHFERPKACVPRRLKFEMAADDQGNFLKAASEVPRRDRGVIVVRQEVEDMEVDAKENIQNGSPDIKFERDLILACEDWDSKVDAMMATPPPSPGQKRAYSAKAEEVGTRYSRPEKRIKPSNNFIDNLPDSWLDEDAIFNGNLTSKVTLDLNDPCLLVDIRYPNELLRTRRIGGDFKRRANKDLKQRYNISNDEAYDLMAKGISQNQVRGAIGHLEIEHSMPALRHQSPFYKEKLSIKEAREYRRRSMAFQINQELRFFKLEHRKGKTYRKIPAQTVLNKAKDLSLRDGLPFILLEHSEEYPTVISNFGMGSRIINYYRRKGDDDTSRPKRDIGETQVLLNQDRSPFWSFGSVDPGEMVPALYNGMIRAPIFEQTVNPTDFLVIRNQDSRESHYFLRNIQHLFVVGQHLPVTGVPGPHSRRVTTAARNRLKMICYRILNHKENHIMAPREIGPHYPESSELQNRQRVKDVLERVGNGLWTMRPGENYHDEAAIRGMMTPEELCLIEAMQVGLRTLADAGYAKSLEDDEEDEKKSHEQRLAPWKITNNFIEATQGKAMLHLHGEGDPTGRGEGFSFIKTTMKGGFRAIGESIDANMDKERIKELGGHQYNVARQHREYTETITRIWKAQRSSLGSTEPPELEIEDAQRDDQSEDLFDEARLSTLDDDTTSQFTRFSAANQGTKVLKIVRKIRNDRGETENVEELITDAKVIRQYIRRRRETNAEKTKVGQIVPTGNNQEDEINKQRLRDELARLQRNKERRELRERQKRNIIDFQAGNPMSPNDISLDDTAELKKRVSGKGTTNRKCANCGQTGHIRTNRKICPKLNGSWEQLGMSPPPSGVGRRRSASVSTPVSS